jgi:hypothetical protein
VRAALAAVATVALGGTVAVAAQGARFKVDVDLMSTGLDADARGRVKLKVRGSDDGRLDLRVNRLEPDAVYELVVDGVAVGTVETTGGGGGQLRLRSRPRSSRDGFLGFDPRGATLVLRDGSGGDVLAAEFPAGGTIGDDDVICCIPDDSGPECEDRTPEECADQGGTVSTALSCLPNPCAGTPPPAGGDVVCCIPDDSGPECEDRTADECAAQGGIVVEADSCLTDPCTAIPPVDDDIRCCLPDDGGAECEDRTPAECLAQGGVDLGAGSCTPNPCSDLPTPSDTPTPSETPDPTDTPDDSPSPGDTPTPGDTPEPGEIRCCEPDDGGFECKFRRPDQCAEHDGIDIGPGSCLPNPCGS